MDQEAINYAVRTGVEAGVKAALEDKLRPFYIDREKHFEHHKFISDWIAWTKQCKSVVLKTLVSAFVMAALGLMIVGFVMKHKG